LSCQPLTTICKTDHSLSWTFHTCFQDNHDPKTRQFGPCHLHQMELPIQNVKNKNYYDIYHLIVNWFVFAKCSNREMSQSFWRGHIKRYCGGGIKCWIADNKSLLDEAKKEMLFSPSIILIIKLIIFKTT